MLRELNKGQEALYYDLEIYGPVIWKLMFRQ